MAIHHMMQKSASGYGYTLEEYGAQVRAFHASTGTAIYGSSAKDAMTQMLAYLNVHGKNSDIRYSADRENRTTGQLRDTSTGLLSTLTGTPVQLHRAFANGELEWADTENEAPQEEPAPAPADEFPQEELPPASDTVTPLINRSESGVALDGAIAYTEGTPAADNPFEEGTDECDEWFTQWDQAADAKDEQEDDERKSGSVVKSKYRQKYTEMGHPTHCGDWLAELLNNYCVGDKHTDLETFEHICGLNGVDTSKYKREGNGWQGRIRMTGRNLLARRVYEAKSINVPGEGTETRSIEAPADWMALQRFKQGRDTQ